MEENKKARNFRQYPVWQMAVDYATKVYKTTAEMPWFEKKGLCDQLQRAVVSIYGKHQFEYRRRMCKTIGH